MTDTIDVTDATVLGQTKEQHRFKSGTYRALELGIDGETYTVPITNVENEQTPTYDAERVYLHCEQIVVEGRHEGQFLETYFDGVIGTDGDLIVSGASAVDEEEASDVDPAERVLWERE